MEGSNFYMPKGDYDLAIFHLEQALQLTLKSVLLENGLDYPRTYSVKRLLEILGGIKEDKRTF